MRLNNKNGRFQMEIANYGAPGSRPGSVVVQSTSALLGADTKDSMLEGILEEKNTRQQQAIYRDIYFHDPVCGGATDLRASMPWSDFSLGGVTDKQGDVFEENINRLNMRSLHPELSVDQMVTGAFVASLIYKGGNVKGFTDLMPFDYADCQIQPVPLYSTEPVVRLEVSPELKKFALDDSPEIKRIKERIPEGILNQLRNSKIVDLSPLNTLYIPRSSMTSIQTGVSYFRRVLPIYLLERVLYRGTISEATRRQRATLHVTAGDDEWIPDEDELATLVGLFQSSESDPISSVVATRGNVSTQEIRSGGDFWKWTDNADQLAALKMRALGINETFLSGEASFNTMETALTVFLEDLRSYRQRTAYQIYGSKLFPIISQLHGFVRDERDVRNGRADERRRGQRETAGYLQTIDDKLNDSQRLVIPEIKWHKQLGQEVDTSYIDVLDKMTEKGVPVTLRMWAAAGGVNLDQVKEEIPSDLKLRDELKEMLPSRQVPNDGGDGESEFASLTPLARFMARDFGDSGEIYQRTVTGKKKSVVRQTIANAKLNDDIHRALKVLRDPNEYKRALDRKTSWMP